MARVKYTLEFERVAVVQEGNKIYKAGDITFFEQKSDGSMEIEVLFDPMIKDEARKNLEKNPHIMGIQSRPKLVTNQLILP